MGVYWDCQQPATERDLQALTLVADCCTLCAATPHEARYAAFDAAAIGCGQWTASTSQQGLQLWSNFHHLVCTLRDHRSLESFLLEQDLLAY